MTDADRFNKGKPELSYILTMPNALREFSKVCEYGASKYERGQYLKGAPLSQYVDSGMRHLLSWWTGEDVDPESGCLHLAHFVWNALMLCEMSISQPARDDRINEELLIE